MTEAECGFDVVTGRLQLQETPTGPPTEVEAVWPKLRVLAYASNLPGSVLDEETVDMHRCWRLAKLQYVNEQARARTVTERALRRTVTNLLGCRERGLVCHVGRRAGKGGREM